MIEFNTLQISSVLYTHKSIVRHEVHVFTYKCMHNFIVNVKRKKTRGKKLYLNFIINIRVQFSESHIHVFIRSHNFTNLVLGANSILKLKLVKKFTKKLYILRKMIFIISIQSTNILAFFSPLLM